jgi:hypothetical protein
MGKDGWGMAAKPLLLPTHKAWRWNWPKCGNYGKNWLKQNVEAGDLLPEIIRTLVHRHGLRLISQEPTECSVIRTFDTGRWNAEMLVLSVPPFCDDDKGGAVADDEEDPTTYFHGTTFASLRSILEHGLRESCVEGVHEFSRKAGSGVYVATVLEAATGWHATPQRLVPPDFTEPDTPYSRVILEVKARGRPRTRTSYGVGEQLVFCSQPGAGEGRAHCPRAPLCRQGGAMRPLH